MGFPCFECCTCVWQLPDIIGGGEWWTSSHLFQTLGDLIHASISMITALNNTNVLAASLHRK